MGASRSTSEWHAAWEQAAVEAATAPEVSRSPTDGVNAWNEAGANHDGSGLVQVQDPTGLTGNLRNQISQHASNKGAEQLMGQGLGAVGAGLGIGKAKSLEIMMRVIGRPGEGRPSEIDQLPSRKVAWVGGLGRDQVKRAVQRCSRTCSRRTSSPPTPTWAH